MLRKLRPQQNNEAGAEADAVTVCVGVVTGVVDMVGAVEMVGAVAGTVGIGVTKIEAGDVVLKQAT